MSRLAIAFVLSSVAFCTLPRLVTVGMSGSLQRFDFEVFGTVQGVFFRKNTVEEAQRLGLRGWCKNTPRGTVQGQAEGPADKMKSMKHWLQSVGSPMSKIEKAVFENEASIDQYTFDNFSVIKKR